MSTWPVVTWGSFGKITKLKLMSAESSLNPYVVYASLIGLFLAIFCLGSHATQSVSTNKQNVTPAVNMQQIAERVTANNLAGDFIVSVEVKEASDFLLTPALLVQEILLEEVLPTYPRE